MWLKGTFFLALLASSVNIRQTDVLNSSFTACDIDGNLALDAYELSTCLETLRGLPADPQSSQTLVIAYDSDGNGRLEATEWENLWTQNYLT